MSFTREYAPSPEPFRGNPLPAAVLGLRGRKLWAKPSPYPQAFTVVKTEEESITALADIPEVFTQAEDGFVIASLEEPAEVTAARQNEDEGISFCGRAHSPSTELDDEEITPYSLKWPMNRAVNSIEPPELNPILTTRYVPPESITVQGRQPIGLGDDDVRTHFSGWTPINASSIIKKRTRDAPPVVRPTRLVTPDRPIKSLRRSPPRTPYNLEHSSSPEPSPCFSDQLSLGWSPNSSISFGDGEEGKGGDEVEAERKGKAKRARRSVSPSPAPVVLAYRRRRSPCNA